MIEREPIESFVLDGEETWSSEAIDDTSILINKVKNVATTLVDLTINDERPRLVLQNLNVLKADGWPDLDLQSWAILGSALLEYDEYQWLAKDFLECLANYREKHQL